MFFSLQAYSQNLRILQNYHRSEYVQYHFIDLWLIARELIDHGANAMEWSEVFTNAWKFIAKYIQETGTVAGHELNASPVSYHLEWQQNMQLQPPI